jgi:hypothetical protein
MILTALLLMAFFQSAPLNTACKWSPAVEAGTLATVVNESSGMAISRRIPNRSYRINDSGDTGRFFALDLAGGAPKSVNVTRFRPADTEDIAIGPCGPGGDCVFIADIGDNARRRQSLSLVVVREVETFPDEVEPLYRVRLKYPDGPHDAEALGVHPNGDVFITTKDTAKSQIFRLKSDKWRTTLNPEETLELVATLDWAVLRPNSLPFAKQVTSMDIAPNGRSFVILNYVDAMEFFVDLSAPGLDASKWKSGTDYRVLELTTLEQQEAIAYLPDGRSLLYDTERPQPTRPARIMRMECR